jgi:hypothetical protein
MATMSLASVIAKESAGGFGSDAEFDDALWLALCERVRSVADLEALPEVARNYYASRYVEWEVGNGGFAQAVLNIPEYMEMGALAFEALQKPQVAARIREALALLKAEVGALPKVRPGNEPALSDYFLDNAFSHLDEGLEDICFWSDAERLAYVRANVQALANAA